MSFKIYFTNKIELQSFIDIMIYSGEFSPATANICEPLLRLTSRKTEWTWNSMHQDLCEEARAVIKDNISMKFYNEKETLYLEPDASSVGPGAEFLQARDSLWFPWDEAPDNTVLCCIAFASKSLTNLEKRYINIGR